MISQGAGGVCEDYAVVIHEEPAGGYWGEVPALPGCYSQGESVDELLANIREAVGGVWEVTEHPERNIHLGHRRLKPITGSDFCRLWRD